MAQNTQNDYNALKRRNRRRLVGAVVMVLLAVLILWQVLSKAPPSHVESQNIVINDGSGTIDTAPLEEVSATTPTLPPLEVVSAPVVSNTSSDVTISDLGINQGTNVVTDDDGPTPSTQTTTTEPKPPVVTTTVKPPKVEKPVIVAKPPKVEKPVQKPSQVNPQDILDGKVVVADASTALKQGKVVIQVAALSDATKAAELKGRLSGLGVNATVSKVSTSKGDISRVRVGPFASRDEAQKTLQTLKNAGIDGIVVSQ